MKCTLYHHNSGNYSHNHHKVHSYKESQRRILSRMKDITKDSMNRFGMKSCKYCSRKCLLLDFSQCQAQSHIKFGRCIDWNRFSICCMKRKAIDCRLGDSLTLMQSLCIMTIGFSFESIAAKLSIGKIRLPLALSYLKTKNVQAFWRDRSYLIDLEGRFRG